MKPAVPLIQGARGVRTDVHAQTGHSSSHCASRTHAHASPISAARHPAQLRREKRTASSPPQAQRCANALAAHVPGTTARPGHSPLRLAHAAHAAQPNPRARSSRLESKCSRSPRGDPMPRGALSLKAWNSTDCMRYAPSALALCLVAATGAKRQTLRQTPPAGAQTWQLRRTDVIRCRAPKEPLENLTTPLETCKQPCKVQA